MLYCKKCGGEMNEDSFVCTHCGNLGYGRRVKKLGNSKNEGKLELYQTPSFWLSFSVVLIYSLNKIVIRLFDVKQIEGFISIIYLLCFFLSFLAFVFSIEAERNGACKKTYVYLVLLLFINSFCDLLLLIP